MSIYKSLAFKNAVLYLFIFLVGLGSIGYLLLNYSSRRIIQAAETQLSHNGDLVEIQLLEYINGLISHIEYLNESPVLSNYIKDSSEEKYDILAQSYLSLIRSNPDLAQIRYIEAKLGKETIRVDRKNNKTEIVSSEQLQIKKDRAYFINTIKLNKDQIYFSEINLNREFGEISKPYTPTLRIAKPIFQDKKVAGVIVINTDLTKLFDRLEKTVGNEYKLRMINNKGYFLMHESRDSTFLFEFGTKSKPKKTVIQPKEGTFHSGDQIFSMHRVRISAMDYDFIYFVVANKSTLLKSYYEWRNKSILIILLIGLLFTVIAFTILNKQSSTLRQLTNNMKAFARKRSVKDLPVHRDDEIGDLAKGFQEMAEVINKQINSIEIEKNKAKQAEQEKSEFIENISHEIRNPLQSIMGLSKILEQNNPNENQIDILRSIKLNTDNLHGLVNNILDYQNIIKGQTVLNLQWVGLFNFLQELTFGNQYAASKESIKLELDFDPKLEDFEIELDLLKVSQILNNLLSNAISSINLKGKIVITASLIKKEAEYCEILYTVSDDGIGMTEDELSKIKNRYFSSKKQDKGNSNFGLGLTIVQELLDLLGSQLEVTSEKHKGSIFSFSINTRYRIHQKINEISDEKVFGSALALIIDDDPQILDLYKHHFNSETTVFAADLEKITTDGAHYDLIISDYNLGSKTLLDYIDILKTVSHPKTSFLISSGELVNLQPFKAQFPNIDNLLKPFNKSDLKTKVYTGLVFTEYGVPNIDSIKKDYDFKKEKYRNAIQILVKEWKLYQARLVDGLLKQDSDELESILHKFNTTLRRLDLDQLELKLIQIKNNLHTKQFHKNKEADHLEIIMDIYLRYLEYNLQ